MKPYQPNQLIKPHSLSPSLIKRLKEVSYLFCKHDKYLEFRISKKVLKNKKLDDWFSEFQKLD